MDDVAMDPELTAINLVKLVGQERDGRPPDPAVTMLIKELIRIGPYDVMMALARLPWSAPGLDHDDVERWLDERLSNLDDIPSARPRFTIEPRRSPLIATRASRRAGPQPGPWTGRRYVGRQRCEWLLRSEISERAPSW
jgi:hypothetical protein